MSFMASLWEKGVWYVGTLMLIVNWNVLPVSSHNHEITGKVATLFVPNGKGGTKQINVLGILQFVPHLYTGAS